MKQLYVGWEVVQVDRISGHTGVLHGFDTFWLNIRLLSKRLDHFFPLTLLVQRTSAISRNGKVTYVNSQGDYYSTGDIETLPEWFTRDGYRMAHNGEEVLGMFLKSWSPHPINWMDFIPALFKGDFSLVEGIHQSDNNPFIIMAYVENKIQKVGIMDFLPLTYYEELLSRHYDLNRIRQIEKLLEEKEPVDNLDFVAYKNMRPQKGYPNFIFNQATKYGKEHQKYATDMF